MVVLRVSAWLKRVALSALIASGVVSPILASPPSPKASGRIAGAAINDGLFSAPSGVSSLSFPLSTSAGALPNDVSIGVWSGALGQQNTATGKHFATAATGTDYLYCDANADAPPAEIVALAAALKNDYNLISQYVYNNIDTEPTAESTKGPLGTYLDRSGNSFDQASLLVSLLRAAGYTAQFEVGMATLSSSQLGLNSLPQQLILDAGGNTAGQTPYAWVQVQVNGNWISIDPANKAHTIIAGTQVGGNEPKVPLNTQNDNSAYINSILTNAALTNYNANTPTINFGSMQLFLGGSHINNVFYTNVTNRAGGTPYANLPAGSYRTGLTFGSSGVSPSYLCTDQLYGHNVAMHGGTLLVDGISIVSGFTDPVKITIWHPSGTPWSQTAYETMTNVNAAVALGAGRIGQYRASHDGDAFSHMGGAALAPNSDQALTATASGQLSQTSHANQMLDQLAGTYTVNHHVLQIVRANNTIDTPMTSTSVDVVNSTPNSGLTSINPKAIAYALSSIQSAQESVALGQSGASQPISAVSLLGGLSDYTQVQFVPKTTGTVSGGYTSDQENLFLAYLQSGYDLVVPTTAPAGGSPLGFMATNGLGSSVFLLSTATGVYKGAADLNIADTLGSIGIGGASAESNPSTPGIQVDPSSGAVSLAAPLISIGSTASPYKLEFDLLYSSRGGAFPTSKMSDGWGFANSLEMRETTSSDGFPLMGSQVAAASYNGVAAAYSMLVASNAIANYYQNGGTPPVAAGYQSAASAAWLIGKSTNNVVTIARGQSQEAFFRMGDGNFHAPTPTGDTISYNGSTWTWNGAHGDKLLFNSSDGQVATATTAAGAQTSFAYTPSATTPSFNMLTKASAGPHSFTLAYENGASGQSPKLISVTDETGRSAQLNYTNSFLVTVFKPDNIGGTTPSMQFSQVSQAEGAAGNGFPLTTVMDGFRRPTNLTYDRRQVPTSLANANAHTTTYHTADNRWEIDDAIGNSSYGLSYPVVFYGDWIQTDNFDAIGKKTSELFNYAGQLWWKRLPLAQSNPDYTYSYAYDVNGNLASTSIGPANTPQQLTTTTMWNLTWNKPSQVTDQNGGVTKYNYYQNGELQNVVQPQVTYKGNQINPTTTYTYDSVGQIATVQAADGEMTTYGYDDNTKGNTWNLLTKTVDSGTVPHLSLFTQYGYDLVGNLNSLKTPKFNTTNATYDTARRLHTKTDPPLPWFNNQRLTTTFNYDPDGRLLETDQATGNGTQALVTKQTYDHIGNLQTQEKPNTNGTDAYPTTYTYDADERLKLTQNSVISAGQTYDADGRPWQKLDGNNQTSSTTTYTDDGLTYQVSDGNGHAITYGYDRYDRSTTTTYADGTFEKRTLDNDGHLTVLQNRAQDVMIFGLDALGRETSEADYPHNGSGPTLTKVVTLDQVGRPNTVADENGSFTYTYDTAGRKSGTLFAVASGVTTTKSYAINYEYDNDGNMEYITYPDGYAYYYTFDPLGEMLSVAEKSPGAIGQKTLVNYQWTTLAKLSSETYANQASTNFYYDAFNNVKQVTQIYTNQPNTVTVFYTLDTQERRQQDSYTDGSYFWHPITAATTTYLPNSLNEYGQINADLPGYLPNGTLQTDPTPPLGRSIYTWDMFNRLTGVVSAQHGANYTYDAFSRRTSKSVDSTTTLYVTDGGHELAEYASTGAVLSHYVYGVGHAPFLQEPVTSGVVSSRYYHHPDALGTTMAISDGFGHPINVYPTSPWGEVATTAGTPYRFAGMRLDPESMLYYDNARYYSPQQGRFISPDPSGTKGGINLYAYSGDDPVNNVDPTGLTSSNGVHPAALGGSSPPTNTALDWNGGLGPDNSGNWGCSGDCGNFNSNPGNPASLGGAGREDWLSGVVSRTDTTVFSATNTRTGEQVLKVIPDDVSQQPYLVAGDGVVKLPLLGGVNPLDPAGLNYDIGNEIYDIRLTLNMIATGNTFGLKPHPYDNYPNAQTGAILPLADYTAFNVLGGDFPGPFQGQQRLILDSSNSVLSFYTNNHYKSFYHLTLIER